MGLGLILALGVGALGIYGHMDAQEMEEKAESITKDAQHMYKKARKALDREEEKAEEALWELGCQKKKVMVQSVQKYLKTYEYIQEVRLKETKGWKEIAKRTIDANGVMQLRELSDIYQRTWIEGSVETSILSTTLISLGAGFLPSLIAPFTFSTALSASVRANENLEKAEAMYAEAELLSEKMRISKVVCKGIVKQAERFRKLLIRLDDMFSKCVDLLESIVQYQRKVHGNAPLIKEDFTNGELKLMATTCALAVSVKVVIDTPILFQDGTVSDEATCIHDEIMYQQVPQYQQEVSMFGEGMKTFAEQVKILEKTFQHSMVINAGLDYDDLQFGMRTSEHASASCMGGVFSIHGADSEWGGKNTILFSLADIQGWTKEYGETVTRDMLKFAICHEMYFLKDMEKADIPISNGRIYVGHGMCYLKGEIEHANEKYQFCNSKRRLAKGDVYEPVIIAPYINAAYADAYAIYIMQISMEYYYELLDNIIRYTIQKSDVVTSEYDASLRDVQENYRKRKKEAALCLAQIHKSEDMPFLRNQLPFWADNVMGNCNLAWGGFTPMDDKVENEIAMALAAIRGDIEDDDYEEEEQHDYIGSSLGSMLGSLGSMFRGDIN